MGIRCIVLDLDQTTLDKQGKLSPGNRKALEEVIGKGIEVVVASGRSYYSLPQEITELKGIHYVITSNGIAIHEMSSGKCLIHYLMEAASVDEILAVISEPVRQSRVSCEGFVGGVPYCAAEYYEDPAKYGASGQGVEYIRRTRHPQRDILGFIRENREKMDCVNVVVGDPALKERLWKQLEEKVEGVYITSSLDRLIELSNQKGGKHAAVSYLLDLLGIAPNETAAFGDGDNDAQMLSFVGAGVAVANATESCKQAAGYMTAAHDEDGVAQWIRDVLPELGME